jgi:hypothetical protein
MHFWKKSPTTNCFCLYLLLHVATPLSSAFVVQQQHDVGHSLFRATQSSALSMSSNDAGSGGGESSLDAMRRLLEGSWNADSMGSVPSSPQAAANEAGGSLLSAKDRGHRLFMVDILLPSYDITQGFNLYDEVEAVNFCVALSKVLKGKTCIIVRDDKTVRTVSRVLDARERDAMPSLDVDDDDDEEDEEDDNEESKLDSSDDKEEEILFDDFAEIGTIGDSRIGDSSKSDVADFRKQLMSDWESDEEPSIEESTSKEEKQQKKNPKAKKPKTSSSPVSSSGAARQYRLTSMLGDASIPRGADMFEKVVQAVAANAQPKEDEEIIIILSAASEEELIGVRSLVGKYQQSKTIVLVNSKLQPTPRELIKAETVYSLLPLIARPTTSETNIFADSKPKEDETAPPKIVVLRRYPRDWEVFIDLGSGFELAATAKPGEVGKSGPSKEWIAGCVKRHLQSKS